jgi:hypothetical protein
MRHLVLLDRLQDARHVQNVAKLDIDVVDNVADQALVAVTGEDHRPVPLLDELAARFGADDAHASSDQDFHVFLNQLLRRRRRSKRSGFRSL